MLTRSRLSNLAALLLGPTLLLAGALIGPLPQTSGDDTTPSEVRAGRYKVDPGHSTVLFKVKHVGVSNFYGRFNKVEGSYTLDPENPQSASITIEIDADSVDTNSADRDGHVKSEEFFDARRHRTIRFESTKVMASETSGFTVTGDLTLRGETREVTFEAQLVGAGDTPFRDYRSGLETRFTILRSHFGMTASMGGIGDEIELLVSLEGIHRS